MGLTPLAQEEDSNTTHVKVKLKYVLRCLHVLQNSNTTLVKVKFYPYCIFPERM